MRIVLFSLLMLGCTDNNDQVEETEEASIVTSECKGSGAKSVDMDTADTGFELELWAEGAGTTVTVHLDDVTANCCPSPGAEITKGEGTVTVDLHDVTSDEACNCVCRTDFEILVTDLEPTSYTVEVIYNDEAVGTIEVDLSDPS